MDDVRFLGVRNPGVQMSIKKEPMGEIKIYLWLWDVLIGYKY